MKLRAVKYTNPEKEIEEAMETGEIIPSFLPAPENLVRKTPKEKITIQLSKPTLDFFRSEAKKHGVPYQSMINSLLEKYTNQMSSR